MKRAYRGLWLAVLAVFVAGSLPLPLPWPATPSALAVIGPCTPTFSPSSGSPVGVGSNPYSVAVGSFNGDAFADLAVANQGPDTVTILLGNGSGGFPTTSTVNVGNNPTSVAVGSFNGDAFADLAVANALHNNVTILLGNGSGGFAPAPGSPVGVDSFPNSVAVGSFNGDAFADLAVTALGSNTVTILLGNGSGGFPTTSTVTVGNGASSVAVGSFNGDAFADLAVANYASNTVTILLGDGSGGFAPTPGSPVGVGTSPFFVAVGSFNGDGNPDLAVVNQDSNNVTILLNSCPQADLGVGVADSPDPVVPDADLTYSLTVQNAGPDTASTVTLTDPLPAGTTFVSLSSPGGWSCTTPAVGANGTVNCSIASLAIGSSAFTLVVHVGAGVTAPGTLSNTVTIDATTADIDGANNSATENTSVVALTPTPTVTHTPSSTATSTVTPTGTLPATAMPTATTTPTATATATASPTSTFTPTPVPPAPNANNNGTGDRKDKDEAAKETEDDKRQRERTNRSGRDEYATEGNVLSVDATASPPTITIGNRDGVVTLVWIGPRDQFPSVRAGDYVQVDGVKLNEQLYEITDLSRD